MSESDQATHTVEAQTENDQIRGKPVSGRTWKSARERASNRIAVSTLKSSFQSRMQKTKQHKSVKDLEKEMRQEKLDEKERKKQERKEREERRIANEKKSVVYQVISNSRKLKRLKRKQLRDIVKLS